MEATHYLDIMIREATISHDLHARLLRSVHYQIKAGHVLGVTWPDWKGSQGEFGLLFRVFGDTNGLEAVVAQIDPLCKTGLIRPFPVSAVPDVEARIAFVRDRSIDKFSPSRAVRRDKRAGGQGEPETIRDVRPEKIPHYLPMLSHTTTRSFLVYITKRSVPSDRQGGREYGLGRSLPDF